MPFQFDEATTASGLRYLIVDVLEQVGIEDSRALDARLSPGQPHHGGIVLSRIAKDTVYSPEARRSFSVLDGKFIAIAAVVTSPIVRAAINIMLRFATNRSPVRMFTDEAQALEWLESQAREASLNR